MTKKTAKKAVVRPLANKLALLVASAGEAGFTVGGGHGLSIDVFASVKGNARALKEAESAFVQGYVAGSLIRRPDYAKRWGNMGRDQLLIEAATIISLKPFDKDVEASDDRRDELQHKAVRSAQTTLSNAKRKAGIMPTKGGGRKPRTPSVPAEEGSPVPVDMVTATPTLASKEDVNAYMEKAIAALLATCDKNAKRVMPQISSALTDCRDAISAALAM